MVWRRKGGPAKLEVAARLRRETTLPIKTVAAHLHLGTSESANARLHAAMGPVAPAQPLQGRLRL